MKIVYTDGSILECDKIIIEGDRVIADDLYTIFVDDIEEIITG
jgi:hypothetical protein